MTEKSISIGVITLQNRSTGLRKLLDHLKPVIQAHTGDIEIVIANNSGTTAHSEINRNVIESEIRSFCPTAIIDSPQNNIATGRNILLDHSQYNFLAFLDDDEYPSESWLQQLLLVLNTHDASAVAGPVPTIFHDTAPNWVRTIDVHNSAGKENAKPTIITSTGNVLMNKSKLGDLRFDESFGKSGGSDNDFFLRLAESGGSMFWASEAIAYEDVPLERSTARYQIHRFIKQGENYKRINLERGLVKSPLLFTLKALATIAISMPLAALLVLTRRPNAGTWMKRAFSNCGKIYRSKKLLYENQ